MLRVYWLCGFVWSGTAFNEAAELDYAYKIDSKAFVSFESKLMHLLNWGNQENYKQLVIKLAGYHRLEGANMNDNI